MEQTTADSGRLLRIGHRGAAGYAPENTLASLRKARSLHVDMVEVDVRETADGHLVLLHDETVDRTTDGTGVISSLSLTQARQLHIGAGQRIPTLDEALDLATGVMGIILELKVEGTGATTQALVMRKGFVGTVLYASFLSDELARLRSGASTAELMLLVGEHPAQDPVRQATALTASHIGLHYRTVSPAMLRACRSAGLRVFVYTVNDPRDIGRMRSLKVDGIISDYPDWT